MRVQFFFFINADFSSQNYILTINIIKMSSKISFLFKYEKQTYWDPGRDRAVEFCSTSSCCTPCRHWSTRTNTELLKNSSLFGFVLSYFRIFRNNKNARVDAIIDRLSIFFIFCLNFKIPSSSLYT